MPQQDSSPLLVDTLPSFAAELESALIEEARTELASQIASLRLLQVCGCGDDFCASFYTGPKPEGGWGSGHENVVPPVGDGMVILDVVDGVIRYVEVLFRDDVRSIIMPQDSSTEQ